ncbi:MULTISPECIES: DUF1830 domain-containing protein [unclassified Coleofasciculus]|uniref:DUF1830 domain-containing protein n=1 Tax=unclassified Coleofasciculus TaxID=2692782 RepID=UPI001881E5D5|nr:MULTISPECIES: DUF1830 domain-containing protein [unclassified Coleofasciculus]MBE9127059.1 DUF1830 domain-containing protein [Coleofasciculus sp. LEGE 07081]MBE9150447.1 DUF1830 domain-containing protein [Coleofasciculus sp. LEGE 07092]
MFNLLSTEYNSRILCYYMNATPSIQIIRIADSPNLSFERVVFPLQRLFFEALPQAHLEIYKNKFGVATLSASLLCDFLRVEQEIETDRMSYLSTR